MNIDQALDELAQLWNYQKSGEAALLMRDIIESGAMSEQEMESYYKAVMWSGEPV